MTNQGDDRTPDKTLGQIKYADGQQGGTDKEARRVVEGGEGDKKSGQQQSQKEGPAAYARHDEGERAFPNREPAKKKTGEF